MQAALKSKIVFMRALKLILKPLSPPPEINKYTAGVIWSLFAAGEERGRCFTIEYVMPMNIQLTSESTVNVLSKWSGGVLPFASCKAPKGH